MQGPEPGQTAAWGLPGEGRGARAAAPSTAGVPGGLPGSPPWRPRSVGVVRGRAGTSSGLTAASPRPDHFQRLLNDSERALQDAFPGAFGELYTQNARAFRDLYAELRRYHRGANLHLEETLAEFWARLLERLFRQLHPQLLLPDDYLDCLGKQAEPLRPFGDAPHELRLRATRAFVAARTFVQGLGLATDVVRKVAQVRPAARGSWGALRLPHHFTSQTPGPALGPWASGHLPTPGCCRGLRTAPQRVCAPPRAAHPGQPTPCPVSSSASLGPGQEGKRVWGWVPSQLQGSGGRGRGDRAWRLEQAGPSPAPLGSLSDLW